MIEEQANVVKLDNNNPELAWVETQRKSSCSHCDGSSSCGTQVLSKVVGQRSAQVKVLNSCHARQGDQVIIGIDEKNFLSGSFNLYFIPLLSMIVFCLTGTVLSSGLGFSSSIIDINAIVFAIVGFVIGVWLTRKRISSDNTQYQARIIRILNAKQAVVDF